MGVQAGRTDLTRERFTPSGAQAETICLNSTSAAHLNLMMLSRGLLQWIIMSQRMFVSQTQLEGLGRERHHKTMERGSMPTIFFYGPELDNGKKKELIKSFTETASRLTGIDRSAFVVYLRACSPDDVGVGGELLRERLERERA